MGGSTLIQSFSLFSPYQETLIIQIKPQTQTHKRHPKSNYFRYQ